MTFEEAVTTLRSGGAWPDLAEAVGVVISSPRSSLLDLALGLKHGGIVAEQAAIALYRRTGRDLPENSADLCTDLRDWLDVVSEQYGEEIRTHSRH